MYYNFELSFNVLSDISVNSVLKINVLVVGRHLGTSYSHRGQWKTSLVRIKM